jgi:phosphoglycolate phosphatase
MQNLAPILVFDLDGTLADTVGDLTATLNVILAREGLPAVPLADARKLIGAGARTLIQRGFAAAGRDLAPENLQRLYGDFITHYEAHVADETRLFPGVEAALDRFAAAGNVFAVCTNKLENLSLLLLNTLGLADRFRAICGQDTFKIAKPDRRIFDETVARAGGDPRQAIMIGDSATDIATARAAGAPVVAVDFGYTDRPIESFGPDRVISHFDELWDAVAALRAPAICAAARALTCRRAPP